MRVRSRFLAALLRFHARRRVLYGRSEFIGKDWLTLLGEDVRLPGGRRGTVREFEYSIRTRRLRCLVELPGGARFLLDPDDILGTVGIGDGTAVESVETGTPTAEGG